MSRLETFQRQPARLPRLAALMLGLLAAAVVTRYGALGDANYWEDEQLFFHIGLRVAQGAIPYVDVWDRKPPGLFLLYALFAKVWPSPWGFQLAALAAAWGTALALALMARRLAGREMAGWVAGVLYLVALLLFDGRSGEAGVFGNLLMAWAAWLVISRPGVRRGWLAMLLAGLAITIKQTTLFEGVYLGLVLVARAWSMPGRWRRIALWAALGAAPMAALAGWLAALGHAEAFWQAMIGANLRKVYNPGGNLLWRYALMGQLLLPLLGLAAMGWRYLDARRWLVLGWAAACFAGLAAVPNLIDHYVIPLLSPLCVLAGASVGVGWLGAVAALGWALVGAHVAQVWQWDRAGRSNRLLAEAAAALQTPRPHPRLFVFDGPMALYRGDVQVPPTPLIFPLHLSYLPERDVSQFSTRGEVARVLAWRPDVVVARQRESAGSLINPETAAMVRAYLAACPQRRVVSLLNAAEVYQVTIYAGCAPPR